MRRYGMLGYLGIAATLAGSLGIVNVVSEPTECDPNGVPLKSRKEKRWKPLKEKHKLNLKGSLTEGGGKRAKRRLRGRGRHA